MTANYLLSKAETAGTEYFSVLHPELSPIYTLRQAGDVALYRASLENWQKTSADRQKLRLRIRQDQKQLVETAVNGSENSTVVLIAGGFHTQGIVAGLQRKKVSYMVIAPRVDRPMTAQEFANYVRHATEETELAQAPTPHASASH